MGKRYKNDNVGLRRGVRPKQLYYKREKKFNGLISNFKKNYYNQLEYTWSIYFYVSFEKWY